MNRTLRFVSFVAAAAVLGFVVTWSFLAYLKPDMVVDFATLLQMCGIPVAR